MIDVKKMIEDTAKLDVKALNASAAKLASTPSDGGVLRMLGMMAVGAGIAAAHREDESWKFRPTWELFAGTFYGSERKRPGTDDKGKMSGEDQYGNALDKLAALGGHSLWQRGDRIRVATFIAGLKKPEGGMLPMPNMGSLAAELVKTYEKAAPSDAALKKHMAAKAAKKRTSPEASEFKRRVAALKASMVTLSEADDFEDYAALTVEATAIGTRISALAAKVKTHFEALAKADKAKTDKPAKKGEATKLTAAQREAAMNERLAAIAAKGSNGEAGDTQH